VQHIDRWGIGIALGILFTAPGVFVGTKAWLPQVSAVRTVVYVWLACLVLTLVMLLIAILPPSPLSSVLLVGELAPLIGLVAGIGLSARKVDFIVCGVALMGFVTQYIGIYIYAYLEPLLGGPFVH